MIDFSNPPEGIDVVDYLNWKINKILEALYELDEAHSEILYKQIQQEKRIKILEFKEK